MLNFAVVPLIVAALTAVVALPQVVLLGVLLVLLTPCIDYVIVFTRLAGGDSCRLLAAPPLLMRTQMAALPLVVVTQTLVELFGMVAYVHTIPRLVGPRPQPQGPAAT